MSAEMRRQLKVDWVVQYRRGGEPWTGTDSQLTYAWRAVQSCGARGERPSNDGERRVRQRRASAAQQRTDRTGHARQLRARRRQPSGLLKGRNAEQLLAYDAAAFDAAARNDLGSLGDAMCTHCGALLWKAESRKVCLLPGQLPLPVSCPRPVHQSDAVPAPTGLAARRVWDRLQGRALLLLRCGAAAAR